MRDRPLDFAILIFQALFDESVAFTF